MRDQTTFERQLEDAFDRYATAGAPLDVDVRAVAAEATAGGRQPRGLALRTPAAPRGLLLAASIGLLLLALLAAAFVAGALPLKPRGPLGGGGRILVTYPTGPSHLLTIDGDRAVAREVRVSGCPRAVGNADAVAANIRFKGITYAGFDGGASEPVSTNYAGTERWSADNRMLGLVDWTDATVTFVSIANGDVGHPAQVRVPIDTRGLRVDADGNAAFDGSFSPDGRWFLLVTSPMESAVDSRFPNRLTLLDTETGAARTPVDVSVINQGLSLDPAGVVWAKDGSLVATVSWTGSASQVATISPAAGEVRWLGRPPGAPTNVLLNVEAFSPDGSRLAVWGFGRLWLVDVATGAWHETPLAARAGTESPTSFAMSPDSRKVAVIDGTTLTVLDVAAGAVETRDLGGTAVAWSPDRSALAVLEPSPGPGPAEIRVYDPWAATQPTTLFTVPRETSFPVGGTNGPCVQWLSEVSP